MGKLTAQAKLLTLGPRPSSYWRAMEIGNRIALARNKAGLSQTQLANAVGVTRGLVGQWESHRKKPGRDNLSAIARATTVSVDFLLGQETLDHVSVTTISPVEVNLLRGFRRLNPLQQKNLLQLVGMSIEVREQVEKQGRPAKSEII